MPPTTSLHALRTSISHMKLSTPVAVIIGSMIIASSIIGYGYIIRGAGVATAPQADTHFAGKPVGDGDYIEGDKDAKVFVIEYSDPECPFCVSLHPTLHQLRQEYGDRIGFVYRHFPLTQLHPGAFDEARAIECSGIVGGSKAYYSYIDAAFGYKLANKTTVLPTNGAADIARSTGLDVASFNACLATQTPGDKVTASLTDGTTAGVQGTPSTFIVKSTRKGYEIVAALDGAREYRLFKAAVDQALK